MTVTARTVETNTADALARLLGFLGDSDNLRHWVTEFEDSFPSLIRDVKPFPEAFGVDAKYLRASGVVVSFEDGSVLHLTVTQIKEPNPDA